METLTPEVTDEGISLNLTAAEVKRLGWKPGQRVRISLAEDVVTIRPLDVTERVRLEAHRHLAMHVGDAAGIGPIKRTETGWSVPIYLSYRKVLLGWLVFDDSGTLLLEESDSRDQMLARANEA